MENLIIAGQITATSNKQDNRFKQQKPTKTLYISVDDENKKNAEEFGLHVYTSKEGADHLILKAPERGISVWLNGNKYSEIETTVDSPNFKTVDGLPLGMAIIKAENMGNVFYRLTDINITNENDIEFLERQNPFA